ncbi:MAG: Fic family protein [Betaproteobacteria bacterium]|nr:Fic family protein [Betaproteobacteria bacterium]
MRKKETLPGIDPKNISVELRKLFDDVVYQFQHKSMPLDEIAARFHHRLTVIHPFPNGNGRCARRTAATIRFCSNLHDREQQSDKWRS